MQVPKIKNIGFTWMQSFDVDPKKQTASTIRTPRIKTLDFKELWYERLDKIFYIHLNSTTLSFQFFQKDFGHFLSINHPPTKLFEDNFRVGLGKTTKVYFEICSDCNILFLFLFFKRLFCYSCQEIFAESVTFISLWGLTLFFEISHFLTLNWHNFFVFCPNLKP